MQLSTSGSYATCAPSPAFPDMSRLPAHVASTRATNESKFNHNPPPTHNRYIPLGGRRTQLWSIWIIFTFVGLWHDLWCVCPPPLPPPSHLYMMTMPLIFLLLLLLLMLLLLPTTLRQVAVACVGVDQLRLLLH